MKVVGSFDNNSSSASSSSSTKKLRKKNVATSKNNQSSSSSSSSSYPTWHNIVAGAAAGAGARFLTAPLDLIKIRRQLVNPASIAGSAAATGSFSPLGLFNSLRSIVRTEGGLPSLFRGNLAATYLWIGYAAVQFSIYARTSDFITNTQFIIPPGIRSSIPPPILHPAQNAVSTLQSVSSNPSAVAFVSGALAGTAATLATYPFDICRTAFAARGLTTLEPSSIQTFFKLATASNSVNKNPLRNLFAGCGPAVLGIIPYMGLNFALYDYLVRTGEKTKVGDAGIAGAIAGGSSKLIVYPLDTVKKRLQAQAFNTFWGTGNAAAPLGNAPEYKNMVDCAVRIMKVEGVGAFYRGLVPTLLKTMGATGLTFSIFTFTKNTLETTHDWCANNAQNKQQKR